MRVNAAAAFPRTAAGIEAAAFPGRNYFSRISRTARNKAENRLSRYMAEFSIRTCTTTRRPSMPCARCRYPQQCDALAIAKKRNFASGPNRLMCGSAQTIHVMQRFSCASAQNGFAQRRIVVTEIAQR